MNEEEYIGGPSGEAPKLDPDGACNGKRTRGSDPPIFQGYCKRSLGWGTDHVGEGRCRQHGGNNGGAREGAGAPKGNQNATTHGATADPTNIYGHLSDEDRGWVDDLTDAYIDESPYTDEDPQAERIQMTVVMTWQERSGRAQLIKEGLERKKIVSASEAGVARDLDGHHLNSVVSSLNTDIRQNLKDLNLLEDAESRKADALESGIDLSLTSDDKDALDTAFGG